jgi:uncharacterized protein
MHVTDDSNRIHALDFLRGIAVLGIALANLTTAGLPAAAQLSPFTVGTDGPLDLAIWLVGFMLVDGKFRALFALMFGASMLLVMESAEMDGRDGRAAHLRRMAWLLPIGLAHHVLLWSGDILVSLALAGLLATALVRLDILGLLKAALALLAVQWVIDLAVALPPFWLRDAADGPGASAQAIEAWRAFADLLGGPGSEAVAAETALYRSDYGAILMSRLAETGRDAANILLFQLAELLAFMALGMAMLKGGFLSGQWTAEQYRATWRRAYLVGLVPMAGLAAWILLRRDPLAAESSAFAFSLPMRLPLATAHAAFFLGLAISLGDSRFGAAVRAVGRMALSNYLLCSLLMTSLFYGYGAGLFARLDRLALLAVTILLWAILLGWSVAWRRRWHWGPAEWVWRWLARRGAERAD